MHQIIQSINNGSTSVVNIPSPAIAEGEVLIRTTCSLISKGTEKMLIDFGKSNFVNKAISQPEKVKEVMEKAKSQGFLNVYRSVIDKLDYPIPLGYCNVGIIIGLGKNVSNLQVGDRVVSNGPHAEFVVVPKNLCALIPDQVSDEEAAFTVLGSIGLQGIRLANPNLGETFVVSGLGLIGLLTAQMLAINGCVVLGLDPDRERCNLAESFGIKAFNLSKDTDPYQWCMSQSNGLGIDGVLITAATKSNEPVELAAKVCRKRGRIILVGVTGMELSRDLFYKKELTFQVSCSYGPGRYDSSYEESGNDYPIGFVRWTEQRNFTAVLEKIKASRLKTHNLISHRFDIKEGEKAYELMAAKVSSLGILITFPKDDTSYDRTIKLSNKKINILQDKIAISVIGSGNYSRRFIIPVLAKERLKLVHLCANSGTGPFYIGQKYGFEYATTDSESIFKDKKSNTVFIATRHNTHASLVIKALKSGKNVFVEKPLCLTREELNSIKSTYSEVYKKQLLMVGFNRRFSPLVSKLKSELNKITGPKSFIYLCNSGLIPKDHWTQKPNIGGGSLMGEACHFLDLLRYLANSSFEKISILSANKDGPCISTFTIQILFCDGSIGTLHYFSNGNKNYPKERIEVFGGNKIFKLDNFKKLEAWGVKNFKKKRLIFQDKGQKNCIISFIEAIKSSSAPPIPVDEIFEIQSHLIELESQSRKFIPI
ncbi:dehydrogenase [bacterium]|nr:dehydrogenase [bacterium]|tara:strand:+ start:269 stop:2398 length:2130 start_codon:yes stop_codon:yes gene_type:complete